MHGRNVDIFNDSDTRGSNCNNLGYKSIGDNVPDVIMTLPNLLNKGAMAREESKQANCITGSVIPGIAVPLGSKIIANFGIPSEYVDKSVAKSATSASELNSSKLLTCKVRSKELSRE
mmetsp:Transcript_28074/g.32742  ORF Transcript_28074/g.32742 Transcript_28074/m.32742 type:complete len:118 (+) Transcript_28074:1227-1580(+)